MGDCGFREGSGPAVPRDLKCRGGVEVQVVCFFSLGDFDTMLRAYGVYEA